MPSVASRQLVHEEIYGEQCHGVIRPETRRKYQEIIWELAEAGAEAVILGCTEIELLITQDDSDLPIFASTTLHARAAVDFALQEKAMVNAPSAGI